MAVGEYSYETLSPFLPPSAAVETTISGGEDAGDYVVFRNEISLTSLEPASTDAAATDYFSLDVDDASDEVIDPTPMPKVVAAEERENDADRTPEWTLESGWFRADCRFKCPMLQLHKEILDFCDFLSPTPVEAAARNAAIERVSDVIKYIWPYCRVEVFGSYRTGLYLPSSDIDVVILESNIKTPQLGLQALSRALSQKGIAKKMQVIGKARVPIIKFLEKVTDVAFDISFDVDNGPKAAEYIQDAISRLPPLRPLCLILKVFLQQRELNEVYSGGVGSYALLAMLIAMLRSVNDCQRSPEQNLGILLVKFFEFYAHRLNTWDVGVSCNGTGTFYLKSRKGFQTKGRPFLISIEDPQTPGNDIGKNSFNYFQIRSAFMMAYATLTNTKTIMNLGPNKSILGTIIRPDPVLLERKGGIKGELTFNNLLTGAGEALDSQYDEKQDILCNWQFDNDYEEEPLPRGGNAECSSPSSSGKKRKASKSKSFGKVKENGSIGKNGYEENGSRKERKREKKRSKFL
ncbi:non-canonical poly(A) RNA polymerase PAPD5-like [Chenopodium quinoa]|uniref:non-canonical poly(A) RNA polymerase PAPD5-like n=1 Tax=Chenopodium quinoa TaxID=63459 RepID=UPI000B79470A|nr:non-canonical poly(A) RNA polymerase PAPD5-like [Chenopodium quinoa]